VEGWTIKHRRWLEIRQAQNRLGASPVTGFLHFVAGSMTRTRIYGQNEVFGASAKAGDGTGVSRGAPLDFLAYQRLALVRHTALS
jgi:hypothetical protein